jgi:ATP-dependent Clp protease ATP-binding subunit ClpA
MPKINVYLPDDLASAVRDAQVPVSAVCQSALERAVRDVTAMRATDQPPPEDHPGLGPLGRFTPRARKALALAEDAARAVPHNYVGTEHLLLGVIDEGTNLALTVLEVLGVEAVDLRAEIVASLGPATGATEERAAFTPLAKSALEATAKEALSLGHNYIGCEHLLLGLIATEDGLASEVLRRMGVERSTTRRTVIATLSGVVQTRYNAAPARPEPDDALQQILRRLDAIEQRLADQGTATT